MTTVSVYEFWPFWKTQGKLRRFDYISVDGSMPPITSVFSYDAGSKAMLLTDYNATLQIQDIWYYDYRPGNGGVAEFKDCYPKSRKTVSMDGLFGRPIFWGEIETIGTSIVNYPKMNPLTSSPPAFAGGCQCVAFEALLPTLTLSNGHTYNDVLQFSYLQSWDGHAAGGARYWFAKGVGPIRIVWLAQDPTNPTGKPLIQTSAIDATVSDVDPLIS